MKPELAHWRSARSALPWWLQEALTAEPDDELVRLEGHRDVDVAIIGGGYTGLWTALALRRREPSLSVAVVEAGICGGGASGRNGGFLHGYWHDLPRLRATFGDEAAKAIARAGGQILPAVKELCAVRGADIWLNHAGHMRVALTPQQDHTVARIVEASVALGMEEEVRPLSRDEVSARCQSPAFRSGVFFPDCATVQPARLARALRRAVLDSGVPALEHSPVLRLDSAAYGTGRRYVLETVRGRLSAQEVILATDAACAAYPALRRDVTNFGSYMVLTEPVPDVLDRIGWRGGEAITDARTFLHYCRTTPDGRIVMGTASGPIAYGGSLGPEFEYDPPSIARAAQALRILFGDVCDPVRITHAWGGAVSVTPDHYPLVGTLPHSRIHYGFGYSGHGTGPAWMAAQILASLVLGMDDEWAAFPWVARARRRFPPEPLKYLGGRAVRHALLACENADEAGKRAPLGFRLAAGIPARIGLALGRD